MSDNAINFIDYNPSSANQLESMLVSAWANTFLSPEKQSKEQSYSQEEIRNFATLHDLPLDEVRLNSIFT
ncbi:MAG: hypothetical protein DI585_04760 [Pseudomonas fluorescens]|nr:MAG: hypothetical protein DI585_04760 [Pseudomonas fluorescens]